ncbi:MAG: hypothetical protein SFU25_08245 [Candidatus Caenarcaniphilales bacterium]|nr:hypothetical protein [Candidatus Caenarcaniphilales bacterium]
MIFIKPFQKTYKFSAERKRKQFLSARNPSNQRRPILTMDLTNYRQKHIYPLNIGRLILGNPESKSNNLGIPGLSLSDHLFIQTIFGDTSIYASVELNSVAPVDQRLLIITRDLTRQFHADEPINLDRRVPAFIYLDGSSTCFQVYCDDDNLVLQAARLPDNTLENFSALVKQSEAALQRYIKRLQPEQKTLCREGSENNRQSSSLKLPIQFLSNERQLSFTIYPNESSPAGANNLSINCSCFPPNAKLTFSIESQGPNKLPKVRCSVAPIEGKIANEFKFFSKPNSHLHSSSTYPTLQPIDSVAFDIVTPPTHSLNRTNIQPAGIIEFQRGHVRYTLEASLNQDIQNPELIFLTLNLKMSPDRRDTIRNPSASLSSAPRSSCLIGDHYFRPITLASGLEFLTGQVQMNIDNQGIQLPDLPQEIFVNWPPELNVTEARQTNYTKLAVIVNNSLSQIKGLNATELARIILMNETKSFFPYYRDPNHLKVGDFIFIPEGHPIETFAQFKNLDRSKVHVSDIYLIREIHTSSGSESKRFICESTDNLVVLLYSQNPDSSKITFSPTDTISFDGTLFHSSTSPKRKEFDNNGVVIGPAVIARSKTSLQRLITWPTYSHTRFPVFGINCSPSGQVTANVLDNSLNRASLYRLRGSSHTKIDSNIGLQKDDYIVTRDGSKENSEPILIAKVLKTPFIHSSTHGSQGSSGRASVDLSKEDRKFTLDLFII